MSIIRAFVLLPSNCPVRVFGAFRASRPSLGFESPTRGLTLGVVLLCYLSMSREKGMGGVGGDSCQFLYSWPLTSVEKSDSDPSVGVRLASHHSWYLWIAPK